MSCFYGYLRCSDAPGKVPIGARAGLYSTALPVSLQAVVDQMDVINDEVVAYINRKNGELGTLTAKDVSLAEEDNDSYFIPEWQRDIVDTAALPH